MNRQIRILLVDDHAIVREGLRLLLDDEDDLFVAGEAATGDEAVSRARALQPDVVLMDLRMPGLPAVEAIAQLRAALPATQVVVLTSVVGDEEVRGVLAAGAIGYLLKDVARGELVSAVRAAADGRPVLHAEAQRVLLGQAQPGAHSALDALTPRERSLLALLVRGRSNKEIAKSLGLTEGTVKGYLSAMFAKLGVESRTQAALLASRHGLT
jgi:DNA-binding NarL/FixJ family response regulator